MADLWVDTSSVPILKICTSLTPITFVEIGSSNKAPADAPYVVLASNGTLSNETVLSVGSNKLSLTGATLDVVQANLSISNTQITGTTISNGSSLSGANTGDQTITLTGDVTGSGTSSIATTSVGRVPTGSVVMYVGAAAPSNWLLCDGSAISRSTYATLYGIIGNTYGSGNGTTTFNLPDLRQRFPLGKATSGTGSTLGGTGGAIDHTHTVTTGSQTVGIVSLLSSAAPASQTITSSTNNPPFQVFNFIIKT